MIQAPKITQLALSTDQYFPEERKKSVIVIHHTASGPSPANVVHGWQCTPERVGVAYIIAGAPGVHDQYKEGDIYQCFDDKFWEYHLGLTATNNTYLNQISIGIEVCNWGQLVKKADGKFYNYLNQEVPANQVCELEVAFRTFKYYHKYSDAQLASLKDLLIYLCDKYNISKEFNEHMFEVNSDALSGKSGIWTHVSYRPDKVDMDPQPNLIAVLKSLSFKSI